MSKHFKIAMVDSVEGVRLSEGDGDELFFLVTHKKTDLTATLREALHVASTLMSGNIPLLSSEYVDAIKVRKLPIAYLISFLFSITTIT
jgi:hypothetical protein